VVPGFVGLASIAKVLVLAGSSSGGGHATPNHHKRCRHRRFARESLIYRKPRPAPLASGSRRCQLLAVALALPASAATQPASCARQASTRGRSPARQRPWRSGTGLPNRATGGQGTGNATVARTDTGPITETIKWSSAQGTTKTAGEVRAPANGRGGICPSNTTRYALTGKVVSSSCLAAKVDQGRPPLDRACVSDEHECEFPRAGHGREVLRPSTLRQGRRRAIFDARRIALCPPFYVRLE